MFLLFSGPWTAQKSSYYKVGQPNVLEQHNGKHCIKLTANYHRGFLSTARFLQYDAILKDGRHVNTRLSWPKTNCLTSSRACWLSGEIKYYCTLPTIGIMTSTNRGGKHFATVLMKVLNK